MKAVRMLLNAALYLGVATVLAEVGLIAALWARGAFSSDRMVRLAAVASNVDVASIRSGIEQSRLPYVTDHFDREELISARAAAGVDCDLKDLGADTGLDDIARLTSALDLRHEQYLRLKADFDEQLAGLVDGATDASLREVQRQLESVTPKLAKDQLIRILDDSRTDPKLALRVVIAILKPMASEKRKKILCEFKGEETRRLHDILREMRHGLPEVSLVQDTRQQLREITDQPTTGRQSPRVSPPEQKPPIDGRNNG